MNRREFLKLVSSAAAAASLAEVAALVPVPLEAVARPVGDVDWLTPHFVELELRAGEPWWLVDGGCVNANPAVVQKVSQLVSLQDGQSLAPIQFGLASGYAGFTYYEAIDPSGRGRYGVYDIDGLTQAARLPKSWGGIGLPGEDRQDE